MESELIHYGVKGMKWGVRRRQNKIQKERYKQYGRLEDAVVYKKKVRQKDLIKSYGRLEDSKSYSKTANKKVESYIDSALKEIDRQLSSGKVKNYDMKAVNDFINKAMIEIDNEIH